MNFKKVFMIAALCTAQYMQASIKNICIDINAVVDTSQMSSAKYVGWSNSLKCLAKYNPTDPIKQKYSKVAIVFDGLASVPAESQQIAYKSHLQIPQILSDWLLGIKTNAQVAQTVKNHLKRGNYSSNEQGFLDDVITMMTTPHKLIATQYVIKKSAKLIKSMHAAGYNVYVTGNWDPESVDHLTVLLTKSIMPYVSGIRFSYEAQSLKPSIKACTDILEHYALNPSETLAVEVETTSFDTAQQSGMQAVLLDTDNIKSVYAKLATHGINLK